jgi:glutaredoxin
MNRIASFTIAATLLAVVSAQATQLYRWVDEDGNITYQDRPPPDSASSVDKREFDAHAPIGGEPGRSKSGVTLYVVPECVSCDYVRGLLEKREVPFKEVNVGTDVAAQDALKKRAGDLSVPTVVIGSRIVKGYVEPILKAELDQAGFTEPVKEPSGE